MRCRSPWIRLALMVGLAGWLGTDAALAADREYPTADGRKVTLRAPADGVTALIFYSTECPISNYYSPTLNAIVKEFPGDKLKMVGVCVDPDLEAGEQARHAREYDLSFPVIHDPKARLAAVYEAKVTPEAIVIDSQGEVRYRGRIDDQYAGRRVKTTNPRTHELRDAIDAVIHGREVAEPETEPVGCPIPEAFDEEASTITYSRDIAAILDRHCLECHRQGRIGPFALETYTQARKRASDLLYVAEERLMPPWKPTPGFGPAFRHDRSMSPEEIATLARWVENGAPEGDPAERPEPPTFAEGWKLGTPDLVIEMPVEFSVPATGGDIYRCFVIPTNLPDDVYVAGVEYRPGNPRVVHHMLGYVDSSGKAREKDGAEGSPEDGYTCFGGPQIKIGQDLGGWAPGVEPEFLPEGIGRSLPKGSDVVLQIHYHPNGKAETDRSRVGLYFAHKPTRQTFHWWAALNQKFVLDPNDPDSWEVKASTLPLPCDVELHSLAPHMHLLGKDMTMWALVPTGEPVSEGEKPRMKRIDLIKIDRWDFQWQNQYYLVEPISLPKGSVVQLVAHFDNSADNPLNPNDPPQPVRWGEATTDEMCIGFFGMVKSDQDLTRPGEEDDLIPIFEKSYDDHRKRRDRQARTDGTERAQG